MKPRIFIGPIEIANYNNFLNEGFKKINIKSSFFDLYYHPHKYQYKINNFYIKLLRKLNYFRSKNYNLVFKIFILASYCLSITPLFFYSLLFYNVFIFAFRKSFLPFLFDLPILKLFKKKIIFLFYGSDGRPDFIDGSFNNLSLEEIYKNLTIKKKQIKKIEKYSDIIISFSAISHFFHKKFYSFYYIGIPKSICLTPNIQANNNKIKILHAPSNINVKGTLIIREILKELENEGLEFTYNEITNSPNTEVIKAINESDFIIDQVYSDTPLAGFATEAAFCGKPVVVAGYFSNDIKKHVEEDSLPPSIYVQPCDLKNAIKKMILDPQLRNEIGKKLYNFVKNNWSSEIVANKFLKIISGEAPSNWMVDPNKIEYLYGWGIQKENAKKKIRDLVEKYGKESLQLSDKPELEKKFIEFAYSDE